MLKRIRLIAWLAVAVISALGGGLLVDRFLSAPKEAEMAGIAAFGGPFTMRDHRGQPVTERNLLGKPSLLFFGFTHCPDICPTTLSDITGWFEELGPDADKVNAYFVTVDPERDTQAYLAEYMKAFDKRITGLVGTPKETKAIADAWRVYFKRAPREGGDYSMDHTASVFLVNRQGRLAGTIDFHEPRQTAIPKLRRLIASST